MAKITPLGNGKSRVHWYDSAGVRHRPVLSNKAAQELYKQVCATELFEKSGLKPIYGKKNRNLKKMFFRELGRKYVEEHLSFTRAKGNKTYIEKIIEKWGDWRLIQITPEQVRPWIYMYLNKPVNGKRWKVSSVKKLAVYFKRVFKWACEAGLLAENPLRYLIDDQLKKRFRKVNKRTRTITQDQFWGLVESLPVWLRRVCICAWSTGMRVGEIINLKWKNIDMVQRLIRLDADDTKEGDSKTIGIDQDLYELLIEIQIEQINMDPEDYVFLSVKGRKINHHFLDRKFRTLADNCGLTGLVIHDFRHCYVTRKRRAGHDKSVIKANTGHHSDSMFDWYNVVDDSEIQELAGFTEKNLDVLEDDIRSLVETARRNGIPLEAIQILLGKVWKVKM